MKPYYEHKGITIYHGDCREIIPMLSPFNAVVTDPPYGIKWSRSENKARASKPHTGIQNDEDTSARDEALDLLGNIPGVVFGSFYAPFPVNLKQVLVWNKPPDSGLVGSVTGFRRDVEPIFLTGDWPFQTTRWSSLLKSYRQSQKVIAQEAGHPHAKPVDLLMDLVLKVPGGPIIDPFIGSGSTLVAAKNLGRIAVGIEIEERYCEIAAKRLSQDMLEF